VNFALLNFKLIPESELQLSPDNRAFQYNDGAFETMVYINGQVRFLESHLNRLQRAANVLQIELPAFLTEPETVAFWIEKLITENKLSGNIRIKLKIWRSGKGLYTPEENSADCLITVRSQIQGPAILEKAGFATLVRTIFSNYSFFKGPNSIQYVLAGIEKKQRNLDEIILLSPEGFVSECLAANIFWVKNNTVFTPEIGTGCIAGIMRENLLRLFQAENIPFREGKFLPEELLQAESVFTTNASGVKIIRRIGTAEFTEELPFWLTKVSEILLD
jgi:branched-subunit amino acid aminotransferase/4-amino-4-deoxychorismate lyase